MIPKEFLENNSPLLPSEEVEGTGYLHTAEVYKAMEMYASYKLREAGAIRGIDCKELEKIIDHYNSETKLKLIEWIKTRQ